MTLATLGFAVRRKLADLGESARLFARLVQLSPVALARFGLGKPSAAVWLARALCGAAACMPRGAAGASDSQLAGSSSSPLKSSGMSFASSKNGCACARDWSQAGAAVGLSFFFFGIL